MKYAQKAEQYNTELSNKSLRPPADFVNTYIAHGGGWKTTSIFHFYSLAAATQHNTAATAAIK